MHQLHITYQDGSRRMINLHPSFFKLEKGDKATIADKCLTISYDTGDPLSILCVSGEKEYFKRSFTKKIED